MKKLTKGFTLIELLVVISIIGMLASIVLVSLNGARTKGRDASRVEMANSIKNALELYYSANGKYPISQAGMPVSNLWTGNFLNPYMSTVPASFDVTSATNRATYISTDAQGRGYEVLYPTETSGYAKNLGCTDSEVSAFGGNNAGCIGMNVGTNQPWSASSGLGGSADVLSIAFSPNSMLSPGPATLSWSSASASSRCIFSDITASGVHPNITQPLQFQSDRPGNLSPSGSIAVTVAQSPDIDSGGAVAVTLQCFNGSGVPGATAQAVLTMHL